MPKIVGFIRRRPDLGFAAFSAHWRTRHRAEAEKLRPWLRGYVQAHLLPGPWPDVQRPADGCPLLWVDDLADMVALAQSEACRTGAALDEPRFMEGRSSGLAVTERVILPPRPAAGGVKLMLFLGARAGVAVPDAAPGGWLCGTDHACGHVRNRALPGRAIDPAYAFDAIEELWWPDRDAFAADWHGARDPAAVGWCDPLRLKAALVDEVEVFAPPPPRR